MAKAYIVHYGELGLKGRNRIHFEQQLVRNIRRVLHDLGPVEISRFHSHITVTVDDDASAPAAEERLRWIPGIAYLAPVYPTTLEIEAIKAAALEASRRVLTPETSFRIRASRGYKEFPLTSPEIEREVGAYLVEATGAPVDLHQPDVTVTIQVYRDAAYVFAGRIRGIGGLPVGSSGRVMVLLSGGIDSPVAAHMILRRGCTVDFVHFHLLRGRERIHRAKVVTLARQVLAPHRLNARLYMVSAAPFEAAMASLDSRVATVVFRRFIMQVAERLATGRQALALITGESIGQVASQTLQNINLISRATYLPILRPLIAMDKQEIIDIAREIGTYETSIEPYQDPCSLHARRPATWAKLENVLAVEDEIEMQKLVEDTLAHHVEEIRIQFNAAPSRAEEVTLQGSSSEDRP